MKNRITCGGVVVSKDGKIVLCYDMVSKDWIIPQGGKKKENLLAGARREIREETGLKGLELVKKLGVVRRLKSDKSVMKIIHFYLFLSKSKTLRPHDCDRPKWFGFEKAVRTNSYPAERAFLKKHKNAILNAWGRKV